MKKNLTIPNHFREFIRPSVFCTFLAFVYVLIILGKNQWDPIVFVRVGGHFDSRVGGQEMGYDGQFGYQIALDPLNAWKFTDIPSYRYQRILYPILVRILSLGQASAIPWVMLILNLAAYTCGVYLLELILRHYDQPIRYALTYGFFIGTLMSLRLDLNELLAYGLVLAGILLWIKKRQWLAVFIFSLAILAKEITILFLLGFAFSNLFKDYRKTIVWISAGTVPWIIWKYVLYLSFHDWGLNSGGAMASSFEWIPYYGWWKIALISTGGFALISLLIVPLAILPSASGLYIAIRNFARRKWEEGTLSVFLSSALIPFLPSSNILDPLGISRAIIGLIIAFLFFGAYHNNRRLLNYSLLFCLSVVFIWKDTFLPAGTFH